MNNEPHRPVVVTINGGSSSIKFALFEPGDPPRLVQSGQIERIGQPTMTLALKDTPPQVIAAPDHKAAAEVLMDAPQIRARICEGLDFLGIKLDSRRNAKNAPLISANAARVAVRVIRTDEELMIVRSVVRVLKLAPVLAGSNRQ